MARILESTAGRWTRKRAGGKLESVAGLPLGYLRGGGALCESAAPLAQSSRRSSCLLSSLAREIANLHASRT